MMTCELDGVMKRHIGYSGAAGAHRALSATASARSADEASRFLIVYCKSLKIKFVIEQQHDEKPRKQNRFSRLLVRALRLADITKVILVLPHRAVCTLIRYFDFNTASGHMW